MPYSLYAKTVGAFTAGRDTVAGAAAVEPALVQPVETTKTVDCSKPRGPRTLSVALACAQG